MADPFLAKESKSKFLSNYNVISLLRKQILLQLIPTLKRPLFDTLTVKLNQQLVLKYARSPHYWIGTSQQRPSSTRMNQSTYIV